MTFDLLRWTTFLFILSIRAVRVQLPALVGATGLRHGGGGGGEGGR